jgi:O-antigen ligase
MEFTILGCALFALIAMGVGLAGSMTGYALLAPVALASALIVWPPAKRLSWLLVLPVLIFSGALLAILGDAENTFSSEARSSLLGREQMRIHGVSAAQDFFPVGSGLGTFEEVYRRYEDERFVTSTFIAHAHNDYLELVIELGAPGLALIALFLCWWLYCLHRLLILQASPFAWAGWIAIGVFLTHSGWDYPLRTAALAAVFAVCCIFTGRTAPSLLQGWPKMSNHRPPRKRGSAQ